MPADVNETDIQGFEELSEISLGCRYIHPLTQQIILEYIHKQFQVCAFPQLLIFDAQGEVVSYQGLDDVLSDSVPAIRDKWIFKKNKKD